MVRLILIAVTLIRLIIILFLGAGDDEAYHWVWSRHLAAGYYDHPPLVAYIIRIFTAIFGDNPFAIHFGALVCMTGFLLIIYRWSKELFSKENVLWLNMFIIFTPVIFLGGAIIAPDSSLGLFWILALYLVYKALKEKKSFFWYSAGISMGFAALSKYNGLLLPFLVILYLSLSDEHRFWLKRKEPYITFLLMFLLFLPVILWNARHGWASFEFQFLSRQHSSFSILKFLRFLLSQMVYLSPVGFILVLFGFARLSSLSFKEKRWEYRYLFLTSFPVVLLFALNSFFASKFGPHWPVLGYIGGFFGALSFEKIRKSHRIILGINLAISVLIVSVLVIQSFYPLIQMKGPLGDKDFTNDFYGWRKIASRVKELEKNLPAGTFLLAERYQTGSQLSLATGKDVYVLKPGRKTGFDFWQDAGSLSGRDALYFTHSRYFALPDTLYRFDRIEKIGEMPVVRRGQTVRTFHLFHCKNFCGPK